MEVCRTINKNRVQVGPCRGLIYRVLITYNLLMFPGNLNIFSAKQSRNYDFCEYWMYYKSCKSVYFPHRPRQGPARTTFLLIISLTVKIQLWKIWIYFYPFLFWIVLKWFFIIYWSVCNLISKEPIIASKKSYTLHNGEPFLFCLIVFNRHDFFFAIMNGAIPNINNGI